MSNTVCMKKFRNFKWIWNKHAPYYQVLDLSFFLGLLLLLSFATGDAFFLRAEFFYKRGKSWISNALELPEKILSNRIRRCWHNLSILVQILSEPSGNFEANFVWSRITSPIKELCLRAFAGALKTIFWSSFAHLKKSYVKCIKIHDFNSQME